MKRIYKQVIALITVIVLCVGAFIGCGYLYISFNSRNSLQNADASASQIPYSSVPETATLRIFFPDDDSMLLTLDFAGNCISANLNATDTISDFTASCNADCLAGFIDRIGGVELLHDNMVFRYTGMQAVKLSQNGFVKKSDVINAVFRKISDNGITRSHLTFFIQNSHTDLTVAECFSWPEWINKMCLNATVIE